MANQANCGVNEAENKVTYDVSSSGLKGLTDKNFSFTIEDINNEESQAIFRVTDQNSKIIRENLSKPFPIGAIKTRSAKLKRGDYVVKLAKKPDIRLDDYF